MAKCQHIRFVDDLAMHSFSRGKMTCLWCTTWCERNCYFNKFYAMGRAKVEWDERDNSWWKEVSVTNFCQAVHDTYHGQSPERFRFSVKGEIWVCEEDVVKVRKIIDRFPLTLFWIPTRAWQDSRMQDAIEDTVLDAQNARVMASLDPCANEYTFDYLRDRGWSILYVGVNEDQGQQILGEEGLEENVTAGMFRCPKTWENKLGHCAICENGCFAKERNDVQLRKHR